MSKLGDRDVGILIVNAGDSTLGPYHMLSDEELEKIVNVNVLQATYLVKAMLPKLLHRWEKTKVKSGLLFTTSTLGMRPIGGGITYSASKRYQAYLAEILNDELFGRVDVLNYTASEVATKMLRRSKSDWKTITPEMAAKVSLRDLGCEVSTLGAFRHDFVRFIFERIPLSYVMKVRYDISIRALNKRRRRAEENKRK